MCIARQNIDIIPELFHVVDTHIKIVLFIFSWGGGGSILMITTFKIRILLIIVFDKTGDSN